MKTIGSGVDIQMKPFKDIFSEKVDELKQSGMTVYQIAEKLECTPNYIWRMQKGTSLPGPRFAAKISRFFNINHKLLLDSIAYQKTPDQLKKDFQTYDHLRDVLVVESPRISDSDFDPDTETRTILRLFERLSPQKQQKLIKFARALLDEDEPDEPTDITKNLGITQQI